MEGVRSFGHSWSAISARIPGRPPLTCRNRWRVVSKRSLVGESEGGNTGRKITGTTTPGPVRPQSVTDNATVSDLAEFGSPSSPGLPNDQDSPNLNAGSDIFLSSYSAATEEDTGTNSTSGDMSHTFDSFLQELCDSESTASMMPHLSNTVGLAQGSPGPTVVSDQRFHESIPHDPQTLGQDRSAERRAELEAEAAAHRQGAGAAQMLSEDTTRSDQPGVLSDWNLEQDHTLESIFTAFPLTDGEGRVAPTNRPLPVTREIHHHHHHYHHYHHHHYHS